MQRKDEIAAKRARLAELKRQREQRAANASRQSFGSITPDLSPSVPGRQTARADLDSLINNLIGDVSRPASTVGGAGSPGPRASRPNSVLSASQGSNDTPETDATVLPMSPKPVPHPMSPRHQHQHSSTVTLGTIYETPPSPVKEINTYNKGVQATDDWIPGRSRAGDADRLSDIDDDDDLPPTTPGKRQRQRQRVAAREEELRKQLRQEIEEELLAAQELKQNGIDEKTIISMKNFPARPLTDEETRAMLASDEFVEFVDRSTKVIERALDEEYDILNDYTMQADDVDDTDDLGGNVGGKGRRRVREVVQFYDPRWSFNRIVTDIDFSPKFPELMLASYNGNPAAPNDPPGIVQVWSMQLRERPEYVFHAGSNVLTAKFSAFHPNLIVGGAYTGQVLVWDTRAKSAPVLKSPLTGVGHTHPVYSIDVVGTENAHNIVSVSTDGVVCTWAIDMLATPKEHLALVAPPPAKTEDLAPTCMAFPQGDPTYFVVGSEEGTIFACHRYDRAGAKAGVDARVAYKGHTAPVMSVDFHPARGPVDLGDLLLSSSIDWSARLWRIRAPATVATVGLGGSSVPGHLTSFAAAAAAAVAATAVPGLGGNTSGTTAPPGLPGSAAGMGVGSSSSPSSAAAVAAAATGSTSVPVGGVGGAGGVDGGVGGGVSVGGSGDAVHVSPLMDFVREDLVYDAKWSPVKPGVFALVDGSGALELWDVTIETEEPVARIVPSRRGNTAPLKSLCKVAWEPSDGKRLATGGIDGQVSVFEVGPDLGGKEGLKNEEWASVKKLVAKLESQKAGSRE